MVRDLLESSPSTSLAQVSFKRNPGGNQGAQQGTQHVSLLQCGHCHRGLNPERVRQQAFLKKLRDAVNNTFPMAVAGCRRICGLNCSKEDAFEGSFL